MEKLLQRPVSDFMTKNVIAVKREETIQHLFQLLDKHKILGVPVVDDENRVVGIVTESDLITHFTTLKTPRGIHILGSLLYLDDIRQFNEKLKDHCAETVQELMTTEVVTASKNATLLAALDIMAEHKINRLPIVDSDGKLVGLVTRTDVVHELAKLKSIEF